MKRMLSVLPALLACSVILFAPAAFAQCVSGTITSQLETSGPFAGLWKYTLDITWDTPQGLSNVSLTCDFDCGSICDAGWAFPDTAGTGAGIVDDENSVPGDCDLPFVGEFNCSGNPSIGLMDPLVKWDALDGMGCEAGPQGSATLCFWVDLPPDPNSAAPIVLVKNGQNVCDGTIMGDCPQCPVGVDAFDWSQVKFQFLKDHQESSER